MRSENGSDRGFPFALAAAAAGACWLLLAAQTALSLQWRMEHDTPLLHYVAWLIDESGLVPYRDIFETSMPGALFFHLLIGKTLGYGDLAFRVVDVAYVGLVSAVSWRLLRRWGGPAAAAGGALFGLVYLMGGPALSLQRDCLAVLPVAAGTLAAVEVGGGRTRGRVSLRAAAAIGALFALAAGIKPQLGIGLPAALWYVSPPGVGRPAGRILREWGAAAGGFAAVFAIPLVWLVSTGGMPEFWRIFSRYLPLHLDLSGDHDIISGPGSRLGYMLESFLGFGGLRRLLPAAIGGSALSLAGSAPAATKRPARLLAVMAVLYGACPALAGQFWNYHWMPFAWFACLLTALLLAPLSGAAPRRGGPIRALAAVLFAAVVAATIRPAPDFIRQVGGRPPHPPKHGRVDAIAGFLEANLRPGETVQPRDWAGGVVHAMLIARAMPATPYLYDYLFHHHVSDPYVADARRRFLADLRASPPRFVIEVPERPRPTGPDTGPFLEFDAFVAERYRVVDSGLKCRIFELDPDPGD